jgi:hypothetical protein
MVHDKFDLWRHRLLYSRNDKENPRTTWLKANKRIEKRIQNNGTYYTFHFIPFNLADTVVPINILSNKIKM